MGAHSAIEQDLEMARTSASNRELLSKKFKPQTYLPPSAHPCLVSDPDHMWYGVGVRHVELVAYARRVGLVEPEADLTGMVEAIRAVGACIEHLGKVVNYPKLKLRSTDSTEYDWVISIYSNYTWTRQLDRKLEKIGGEDELLTKISQELGLNGAFKFPGRRLDGQWHYARYPPDWTTRARAMRHKPLSQKAEDKLRAEYAKKGIDMDKDLSEHWRQ
ncbi:hypothetical protein BC629DRAFT_1438850 [Irpex lacteus]|nr:hypothetical protein BC629DRAFT_1438850 [Irpex lacteus]